MGKGNGDAAAALVGGCCFICIAVGVCIWSATALIAILGATWVPADCKVHGVWLEQHWRTVQNSHHHHYGSSTSQEDFWQYHFEVEVVGKSWPRADACFYDMCRSTEYNSKDDAAWWLNDALPAPDSDQGACKDAGYSFDGGIMDFVDTDSTNQVLMHGVNCRGETVATTGGSGAQGGGQGQVNVHVHVNGGGAGGGGYNAGYAGAAVNGAAFRTAAPCNCRRTYKCWYNADANNVFMPNVKMDEATDPTWYYWVILLFFGVFPCCSFFVCVCGTVFGAGPASSGAKFDRQWSRP